MDDGEESATDGRHHRIKVFEVTEPVVIPPNHNNDAVTAKPRPAINHSSSNNSNNVELHFDGSTKAMFASSNSVTAAAHITDPYRWQYARKYKKYDPDAWREDGSGFLQQSCAVLVHDYGEVGGTLHHTSTSDSAGSLHRSTTPPMLHLAGTGKRAKAKPAHICRLEINGRPVDGTAEPIVVSSVKELLEAFPPGFFDERPDWACVRWVDVEGTNGEVIQYLLKTIDCERSQYFQHVVRPWPA